MDDWSTIIIILIVGAFAYIQFSRGPIPYNGRSCTGKAWKKAFPNETNDNIRRYLECFVDGMALSSNLKLKFHPNDQVIDVYRSLYGGKTPRGDNMECETFIENLASVYNKELSQIINMWREDITLGELFEFVRA